ncbi:MAG: glycine cleavage system aminomethyltransferase GcvT, partial [Proteobacteria bacterium]|nr:glycine cleavage system aminomethyltransferase GcvT [Pseudomonadota bacterium]
MSDSSGLKQTALFAAHQSLGAKMVPFAGYEMPVQYPDGILTEHNHTRASASVFDVGHMGQAKIIGANAAAEMEKLVPGDIQGLSPGQMRYTQLTNEAGGIIDDLMVTRRDDHLFLVVNAGRKEIDFAHIEANLGGDTSLEILDDRALIALQGPRAAAAVSAHAADAATLPFMTMADISIGGIAALVSRSGYTGEDGYEISLSNQDAAALLEMLLDDPRVKPAGLGARDSLRLEAGLCLYGNDIDET